MSQSDLREIRKQLTAPFAAIRTDVQWDAVTTMPGLHEDKVIVVSGGAVGLGKDIVWWTGVFGGATVYFCDVNNQVGAERADTYNEQIAKSKMPGKVIFRELDVTDPAGCRAFIESVIQENGKLNVLINNAGIAAADSFLTADPIKYRKFFDVNVNGVFNLTQPFLQHVDEGREDGSIDPDAIRKVVTVDSIAGVTTLADRFSYGVSKFALAGLIRSLIIDHGDIVDAIGINPGRLDTEMAQKLVAGLPEATKLFKVWERGATQRSGRALNPMDVAAFISLASSEDPLASVLKGTLVSMDDGWSLGHQPRIQEIPLEALRQLLAWRESAAAVK